MTRATIAGILIATLTGCATKTVPLASSIGSAYRGKSITYSIHETPGFSAMTADKAAFGGLGAAAMISKGNEIIQENKVQDPAATIGATLVQDLATKYGLIVQQPTVRTAAKKPSEIASVYKDADLVLDIQTRGWGFAYFPLDWNNYYIMYSAKLQLIDTKQGTVLAVGSFAYDSKDNEKHPSYKQLTDNQAEGLKLEIIKARNQCIIESRQRIFNAR
jgi:hypothetical protein